uniref:cation:dicarboxylate symporter family transporter n=1 Tax=uncultured Corynebacterium sp. TaxID=159447 RepID=UPI00280534CB
MSTRMRFTQTLLFRVIVAIILGIVCSFFFPEWLARIFVTFNGLFGNFLGFFIPVLIFALITPAIASLGRGAGKWLGITTAIAYGSTVFSGLLAYGATQGLYPWLLGADQAGASVDIDEGALESFFNVEMPPPFDVMTALLLAFTVGVAMTTVKSDSLYRGATQLRDVIMKIISAFIIP